MTRRHALAVAATVAGGLALSGIILISLARWSRKPAAAAAAAVLVQPPQSGGRRIKARLFYVSEDGLRLTGTEQDVQYGEGTVEQAKAIINAQLAAVSEPLLSAVPPGVQLRALFVTPEGEAYVDVTREIATGHPGGSQAELLTVYTIVQALTVNLPAVTSVQLLVDGKEVDTLAGHVDLHRPLAKNPAWIE